MKAIWKYELKIDGMQTLSVPSGFQILDVQVQRDQPCLWIRVDPASEKVDVKINTYGTGHSVQEITERYIGSYQVNNGDLVFHVFEEYEL